jgi:hypothetical protein
MPRGEFGHGLRLVVTLGHYADASEMTKTRRPRLSMLARWRFTLRRNDLRGFVSNFPLLTQFLKRRWSILRMQ